MTRKNKSINAGVHTGTGIDFQKYCAIYVLLDNYHSIKAKQYFIILEHHDDLVFGYLTPTGKLELIEAYQAKKSSSEWGISKLYEILKKIVCNGNSLRVDTIQKEENYSHNLHFITNNTISLKVVKTLKPKREEITCYINEEDHTVGYPSLDDIIKTDIETKLKSLLDSGELAFLKELDHVSLRYVDLAKTSKSQHQQLVGMFGDVFGKSVHDHKAAIDLLLKAFKDSESTFNQGGAARLDDSTKRVESAKINEILNVITSKTKAYDLWRKKDEGISDKLGLSLADQSNFKIHFENSFDEFKDLTQTEHQKILSFVNANVNELNNFIKDEDCIKHIYDKFKSSHNSQLSELQIKAAIFAAYIEIKG